jgi:hypothetical protein
MFAWRDFRVDEATWEPYFFMAVDVSKMVAKFMESHDDPNISKMRSL